MKRLSREVDFEQFLMVLWRKGKPDYLPFFELFASPGFIAKRTETRFDKMCPDDEGYWEIYVDFWLGMGFDCIPMELPLKLNLSSSEGSALSHGSESQVAIRTMEDFERFPWPDESNLIDFRHFETVGRLLPKNIKIIGGVGGGSYEWTSWAMGTIGMAYALADNPEVVELTFQKIGSLHISGAKQLAQMDSIGAVRQGDDLGFKTATFLSPDLLRKWVFPTYRQMAEAAHENGKPFILHSCGNLAEVYDDLIDYCKIDAKHSFEDAILPVSQFKREYGNRITALGGLDVDVICRSSEEEVRAYARNYIEECFSDGYWALGTGNSLADYIPLNNYIAVLEEGLRI